jgi:hypothetical protein
MAAALLAWVDFLAKSAFPFLLLLLHFHTKFQAYEGWHPDLPFGVFTAGCALPEQQNEHFVLFRFQH